MFSSNTLYQEDKAVSKQVHQSPRSLETTRTQTSNCCSTCTPCHVCWFNLFLKSSVCFTSFNQSQLASADPLRLKKLKPNFLCTCDVPELQSDFLFIRPVQQLNGEIHCRRKQSVLETQQERNETAWRHIYTGSSKYENKPKFHFASSEVKPLWNYSLSAKKWELVSSSWTCTHSQLLPVTCKYLNKQRVSSCNYSFSILYTWGLNQVTNPQFLIVQTDWRLWHHQWSPLYLIQLVQRDCEPRYFLELWFKRRSALVMRWVQM